MIQELLARAAEDLTVALNNFETARKELTDDELAAFKEVCRKAKEAVQEALEAAKGALDTKTAETIRQIETLLAQSTQAIERKITEAKQDVDTKVQQGLTNIAEKTAQGVVEIGTKEQQASDALNNKVTHVQQLITTVTDAQNTLNKKTNEAKQYIDNQLSAASTGIDTKIRTVVQTHMTGEEAKLLEKVNQKFIQLFTSIYTVQFPGMPRPDTVFTFEGYRWAEVNYDGCFFRAKGTGAEPFGGGVQGDAIRKIKGDCGYGFGNGGNVDGAFRCITQYDGAGSGEGYGYYSMNFDIERVVPTANENRPRNLTIVIWKLEKV